MPTRPPRPCTAPGCGALTYTGRCELHKYPERAKTKERGYGSAWRKLRMYVLRREPMCRACKRRGATEVDHILPLSRGGTNALSNLQPLCKSCHSTKTTTEDGGFGRVRPQGSEVEG